MCGIVGLISKKAGGLYHGDLEMFKAMLVNDSQRGEDSTGSFMVDRDGNVELIKVASHPFHLFACDAWDTYQRAAVNRGRIVVGHNRKATQGAINSLNAHPFAEGEIVLVHNGTLRDHKSMNTGKEVDSHAICHAFNEKGHEAVIPTIDGAFALVWYNLREHKLYMIRNKERPLCLTITKDMIAFSSEMWMAQGQFMRKGEKIEKAFQIDEGWLYEFDIKTGDYTTKKLELYTPPPVKVYSYQNAGAGTNHNNLWANDDDWEEYINGLGGPIDRPIIIPRQKYGNTFNSPLVVGDLCQVKIDRVRVEPNFNDGGGKDMLKIYGKAMGKEGHEIDCVGWLHAVPLLDIGKWAGKFAVAEVKSVNSSASGPSVWLKDIEMDDELRTHVADIGKWTWDNYVAAKPCSKCCEPIDPLDNLFTSVSIQSNRIKTVCHKCIENALPNGEIKNVFVKRRDAALQNREQQCQEPVGTAERAIQLAGPTTVQ